MAVFDQSKKINFIIKCKKKMKKKGYEQNYLL